MIAKTAFLAALTVFLLAAWLAGQLSFLAPYKAPLFRLQGTFIAGMALMVFPNLCAAYHLLARWVFRHESGRKPTQSAVQRGAECSSSAATCANGCRAKNMTCFYPSMCSSISALNRYVNMWKDLFQNA